MGEKEEEEEELFCSVRMIDVGASVLLLLFVVLGM